MIMVKTKNHVRKLRKEREITLEALAERTGISTSFLSRIEKGTRGLSLENAILIARALKVQVHQVDESFGAILGATDDQLASLDQELVAVLPKLSEDSRKSLLEMARRLRALESGASSR